MGRYPSDYYVPQIHKNPIPRFIVPLTLTLLIKSIWELRWSEAEYFDQKKIFLDIYFLLKNVY